MRKHLPVKRLFKAKRSGEKTYDRHKKPSRTWVKKGNIPL